VRQDPFFQNVVVLTGASLGIGRQTALQLADKGAWIVIASRNAAELERVAEQCRERGGRVVAVSTDIADPSQCRALMERAVEAYGRIDTLINNAGIGQRARFDELADLSVMETVMRVNYWGSVHCTHFALPHLKATKGRIAAVISGAGLFVAPSACGYGASKHAQVGFFNTLRVELAQAGVSVTLFYPNWVETGISGRAPGADGRPYGLVNAHERGAMSAEKCAKLILRAVAARKREAMSLKNRLGRVLAPILPGLVDKIAAESFLEPD
jgi:short-subunit dehydrogenase